MRANGFTLIEVLVALVAGALLLSSVSWAIARLTHDVQAEERHARHQRLTIIANRLTTLIGDARAGPKDIIELSDRSLTVMTNPPLSFGPIGLVQARLEVVGRRGQENLTVGFRDDSGRVVGAPSGSSLLTNLRSIRFSWAEDLTPEETSSPAVQIEIIDQKKETSTVIIPLAVTGDPACQFDPISMACR